MLDVTESDPIRARRATIAKWTKLANRVGYLVYGVGMVVFFVGFATSFNDAVAATVIASLVVGSILLAPAIVLGYAVKAADRQDRELGL